MTDVADPRRELLRALAEVVGDEHVVTDPVLMEQYVVDWARRFRGPALAIVRPLRTDDVSAIMRLCSGAGVPVIVQGGNTGLVGGSVPSPDAELLPVILSMRRLNAIGDIDNLSGQLTVGAGATLGDVRRSAAAAGWVYGVDLAARDSATIGGTVATNAGGIHVIAYGMTRAQVVGIEAVLPDGSVISHLSGLLKDNTGYDLGALLCGSEGTLGVITAIRLRLHRPPGRSTVVLVGCENFQQALAVMASAVAPGTSLLAAEVIDATGMDLVCAVANTSWPTAQRHALVLLLEVVDGGDGSGLLGLEDFDVAIGLDAAEQARLWEFRERQSEAFSSLGVIHKLDVSLPLPVLAACAEELRSVVAAFPDVTTFGVFGHVADGNLHVEIHGPSPDDETSDTAVLECVARYGGSISAEHGVGRAKAEHLSLCRTREEIAAMRAIKSAWDPNSLMNPGVIFAE